jgi:aryl-alcohol dehydrogenase-like predicted oxidoreductase
VPQLQELLGAMQLDLGADEVAALDRASATISA